MSREARLFVCTERAALEIIKIKNESEDSFFMGAEGLEPPTSTV